MTTIRLMTADDISQAGRIIDAASAAWGTHLRQPEPRQLGARIVENRFHKEPAGCFVAEEPTQGLVGVALSITWGSIGWLGPLMVHPTSWEAGIEQQLLRTVLDYWEPMNLSAQGVETFPESSWHVALYAAFGFRPQFLTAMLIRAVDPGAPLELVPPPGARFELIRLSQLSEATEETMQAQCRRISERHYPGLDYSKELASVKERSLGDTLLLAVGERLYGFAICHLSEGSEAEGKACYVKALLIDPAIDEPETLLALVQACEGYARMHQRETVRLGINLACWEGYLALAERGYQMCQMRVRMVRPVGELLSDASPFHCNDWQ